MKNKDLIIDLIRQDLKHNQLIANMEKIGIEAREWYCLGIMEIVSKLMKVPEGKTDDRWGAAYMSFMEQAANYELTVNGESLIPLADVCYRQLKAIVEGQGKHVKLCA